MDPFDELAQALARGMSRRQALRRFAGGLTAAIVATMLPWRPTPEVNALGLYASGANVSGTNTSKPNSSGSSTSGTTTSGASVSGMAVPPSSVMVPSVQMGANGPSVEAIQYLLRQNGADIEVDGDFGEQTDEAVHAFQQKNGLTVDGVVGPETWGVLFVAVQKGDQGDAVSAVQTLLNVQGQDVEVDGDFGDQTEGAVKRFQTDFRHAVLDRAGLA